MGIIGRGGVFDVGGTAEIVTRWGA